jgi:hypothetical protein
MEHALLDLVEELERDRSLDKPHGLRQRIEALDRLDEYFVDAQLPDGVAPDSDETICRRAHALRKKFEAANAKIYAAIRKEIQRGARPPATLLQWLPQDFGRGGDAVYIANGVVYDFLDALVSGVLQFQDPGGHLLDLEPEMVFYQPTPARHICEMIRRTVLGADDVLIDFGSGLGHVPLLASICTEARCIGIERDEAYVRSARQCAAALNLKNAAFLQQDAREADLSAGTVFYFYTPFTGTILRAVLDSLRREAERREIRVCAYGPCVQIIAEEKWIEATGELEAGRVAIFRSCEGGG